MRGEEAARLSMVDEQGREYFTIVVVDQGRRWRERRDAALTAVEDAIMSGAEPGEIRVER